VAQAILDKAKTMGIPTKVEPELVEFLMQVKLNDVVPPELYAAVAEVLAWAYDIDGKLEDKRQRT
jgi:flagellar biosynthesis protein